MRKFKFRVWSVAAEKFVTRCSGEFGWPDSSEIKLNLDGELFIEAAGSKEVLCSSGYIVQQFTGLFDSENQEIYEGDVLEISYQDYYSETKDLFYDFYEVIFYCGDYEVNDGEYTIALNGFCAKKIKTTNKGRSYKIGTISSLGKAIKIENCGAFGLDAALYKIIGHVFETPNLLK